LVAEHDGSRIFGWRNGKMLRSQIGIEPGNIPPYSDRSQFQSGTTEKIEIEIQIKPKIERWAIGYNRTTISILKNLKIETHWRNPLNLIVKLREKIEVGGGVLQFFPSIFFLPKKFALLFISIFDEKRFPIATIFAKKIAKKSLNFEKIRKIERKI
jgi:hypothetical protein